MVPPTLLAATLLPLVPSVRRRPRHTRMTPSTRRVHRSERCSLRHRRATLRRERRWRRLSEKLRRRVEEWPRVVPKNSTGGAGIAAWVGTSRGAAQLGGMKTHGQRAQWLEPPDESTLEPDGGHDTMGSEFDLTIRHGRVGRLTDHVLPNFSYQPPGPDQARSERKRGRSVRSAAAPAPRSGAKEQHVKVASLARELEAGQVLLAECQRQRAPQGKLHGAPRRNPPCHGQAGSGK